jgi:hypothetical protein
MKTKFIFLLKILIMIAVLCGVAFLIQDSSDTQRSLPYDPRASTTKKFGLLQKWIPSNVDIVIVADLYRLKAIAPVDSLFQYVIEKGVSKTMLSSALGSINSIGMIVFCATLDEGNPSVIVIVQSDFQEPEFLETIRTELEKEKTTLLSEIVNRVPLYWQEGSDLSVAISFPDPRHLLIGTKDFLIKLLHRTIDDNQRLSLPEPDAPLFGTIRSSNRIKKILPQQIASVEQAQFSSDDSGKLHIVVTCTDNKQAENLKMFLAGMKALYALQQEGNTPFLTALDAMAIGGEDRFVRIDTPIKQLPALFSTNL